MNGRGDSDPSSIVTLSAAKDPHSWSAAKCRSFAALRMTTWTPNTEIMAETFQRRDGVLWCEDVPLPLAHLWERVARLGAPGEGRPRIATICRTPDNEQGRLHTRRPTPATPDGQMLPGRVLRRSSE